MEKIIEPAKMKIGAYNRRIHCKIKYIDGKLSISGVIGAMPSGNAYGGCGQIDMEFKHRNPLHDDKRYKNPVKPSELTFSKGWNREKWYTFLEYWHLWHLNDMKAECEHQRVNWDLKAKIEHNGELKDAHWVSFEDNPKGLLGKPCEICGYKYGTAWKSVDVPEEVIQFLFALPEAETTPAWV